MTVHNPEVARVHRLKVRLWSAAGILALAVVALIVVQKLRGPLVPAVEAKKTSLSQRVVVSGRVTPPSQIQVGSNVSGTVLAVKVEEGEVVEPGATLVELDAKELDAAVAQARASVLQSRARLAQLLQVVAPAQGQAVRQAELAFQQAERHAERVTVLAKAGSVSQSDLDDAVNGLAIAESRLAGARAQASATSRAGADIRGAEANMAQAEAQLAAAQARRALATLTSPVKAQVLRREVEPGDAVSPGRVLLVLARVGATRLSVEPDEKNLAFIERGQSALASADAFPDQRFEAQVDSVAPSVNPERGTVEVKLLVPNPPPYLRPDMTVSVEIQVAQRDAAIVLPTEAIQDAAKPKPFVFKLTDGRVQRADVRLGLSGQGKVEVVEGVSAGELILMPASKLSPGSRARPALKEG